MIVVDTSVLVYAVGEEHRLAGPCRTLIDAVGLGHLMATTAVEVVQEFVSVRARRRGRIEAASLGSRYVELFEPLLVPDGRDVLRGLRLFQAHERLGAFDAVLGAAARELDATLVSADAAFSTVEGLRHIDPGGPELASLLDGGE